MAQNIFSDIDSEVTTGLMLAALLDDFKDALMSGLSGTTRPSALQAGGLWVDTSQQDAPNYTWTLRLFNGASDLEVFKLNVLSGSSGFNLAEGQFTIRHIGDDTTGAILNLIKNRVAGGGQVLNGDTVARINITGRTDTGTAPVVAYLQAVATGDMTASDRGVGFSLLSTPVGSNTVYEHLKFLAGTIESVLTHKFNAVIYGQDTVTTGTDLLVNGDKLVTEVSAGTIHGIESSAGTKYKILFNSGTGSRALKHQSTVVDAEDRLLLPYGGDIILPPNGSATFYYCDTDSRWKYVCGAVYAAQTLLQDFSVGTTDWVAPATGVVVVNVVSSDTEPISRNFKIDVVAGTTYKVVVDSVYSYFGSTFIGSNLAKASLYQQI